MITILKKEEGVESAWYLSPAGYDCLAVVFQAARGTDTWSSTYIITDPFIRYVLIPVDISYHTTRRIRSIGCSDWEF